MSVKRGVRRSIATRTIAISAAVLTVAIIALSTVSTRARIANPWIKAIIAGTRAMNERPAHIGWRIRTTVRPFRIIVISSSWPVTAKKAEGRLYPSLGEVQSPGLEKRVGSFKSLSTKARQSLRKSLGPDALVFL